MSVGFLKRKIVEIVNKPNGSITREELIAAFKRRKVEFVADSIDVDINARKYYFHDLETAIIDLLKEGQISFRLPFYNAKEFMIGESWKHTYQRTKKVVDKAFPR